jgi:hypothetical protein
MNPTHQSSLPTVLDPLVAAVMEQLKEQVEAKRRALARSIQAATSFQRIWNGSTRSSLARLSNALAASAAKRKRSSATSGLKCCP